MRLIDPIVLKESIVFSAMMRDGKSLERIIDEQPTVTLDNGLQKLAEEIAKFKRTMRSDNSDYFTGYMSALSMVEGMIADMMPHEPYEGVRE